MGSCFRDFRGNSNFMSTLLIEGGQPPVRRGRSRRQQERGAAAAGGLPADDRRVRAHQRAAHQRRRGDGAPAARSRRRGGRHRHHDAARAVSARSSRTSPTARWSAGCADRCCCSVRCWRGAAARSWRRPAAIFRRAGRSARISKRSRRWARAWCRRPGHVLEAPDGLKPASIYLYEASVTGTETALLAAAAASGISRDPPRRLRAARRRALRVPRAARRRRHRRRHARRFASRAAARLRGAEHRLWGDYIEAGSWAVVAAVTGGEIDVRGARAEDMEVVAAVLTRMNIECAQPRRAVSRRTVERRARPAASRPACGRGSRAISSAWSRCWRRRPKAGRWCTTGCTSCVCSRSSR